jgi:hypothetical protein
MAAPIKLTIYDPETHESVKELQTSLVPWGILKRAIRLVKSLGGVMDEMKTAQAAQDVMAVLDKLDEGTVDELTGLVCDVFGGKVTIEELNRGTEIMEMVTVLQAVVSRAMGSFGGNPTPPGKQ